MPEEIEFEIVPPVVKDGSSFEQITHRSSRRLFFFPTLENTGELLYCSCLFEVHWLRMADYRRKNLNTLGVEYVKEGSLHAVQNGREYRVGTGEIFLMRPGCESEIHTGPEGHCRKNSLALHGPLLPAVLHASGLDQVDKISEIDHAGFEALLERFRVLSTEPDRMIRRKNGALSYELLRFLQFPQPEHATPERFEKIAQSLAENPGQSGDLNTLARRAGCSPNHRIREFTRCFGTTPGRYLHGKRMQRAAELLLEHPELSVKEISSAVGYSDALNFSTAFRKYFGNSPLQYRKSHS